MLAGYNKIDITPKVPCPMLGFHPEACGVLDPIYTHLVRLSGYSFYVFDLMFVPFAPQKPKTIYSATHTHSSIYPPERLWQLTCEQEEVKVEYGEAPTPDLVCRRKKIFAWKNIKRGHIKRTYEMRPNPEATIPQTIKVLRINLDPPVIMYNFGCHCTMNHQPLISADWPGYVQVDDAEMVYLQGFGGDVLPNLLKQPQTIKDKIIAKVEGTNDFKKHGTTQADMEAFAASVSERLGNVAYREIG